MESARTLHHENAITFIKNKEDLEEISKPKDICKGKVGRINTFTREKRLNMGVLYEKPVTLQLTFRIAVHDDPVTKKPSYISSDDPAEWKPQLDEQLILLQALLKQDKTDLQHVLLVHIAWFLSAMSDTDWEQALLGHLGFLDPSFCRGSMLSSTIATLSADDQALWKERIETDDPNYGNLFHLCTEDMDRCFQVRLEQASLIDTSH